MHSIVIYKQAPMCLCY